MRTAEQIKKFVNANNGVCSMSDGRKGALIGLMNKYGDDARYRVLGFLFNDNKPMSSKKLTKEQWLNISLWADQTEIDGTWLPQSEFYREFLACLLASKGKRMYVFD